MQAVDIASRDGASDIIERLDQMDVDLESLEERVAEGAQELSVFFNRYVPAPIERLGNTAVRDRLKAIEERLAAVNKALQKMKVHRDEAA